MRELHMLTGGLKAKAPPPAASRPGRRWLPMLLAAVLALSACGNEAAGGQFALWFGNMAADPRQPEASEELLASMGTVIGQSQTADGVTVTLNGAVWDGYYLVLSLSLEGEGLDAAAYSNSVTSEASWLDPPRESVAATLREQRPDLPEEDLQAYLDSYYGPELRAFRQPRIDYLYDRDTGGRQLQVSRSASIASEEAQRELTLHLENLSFCNTVVNGPFDFTFTVERKQLDRVCTGSVVIRPEESPALRITGVTVSPFRVEALYETVDPVPNKDAARERLRIGGLRTDGQETDLTGGQSTLSSQWEDGRLEGSMSAGPFHQVVDPAAVEAVELCGVWVELSELALTEPAEP